MNDRTQWRSKGPEGWSRDVDPGSTDVAELQESRGREKHRKN